MMTYIDVREAARILGINTQRVRAVIADGTLHATKASGVWLIDPESVYAYAHTRHSRGGRPLSPTSAWAALLSRLGTDLTTEITATFDLKDEQKRRIKALATRNTGDWVWLARNRASVLRAQVRSAYLTRIAGTGGVVRTGLSTVAEHGLDLTNPAPALDIYTDTHTAQQLVAAYSLRPAAAGNLTLRTVNLHGSALHLVLDRQVMPATVVGVDLIEQRDERTSRAGQELLQKVLAGTAR